MRVLDHQVLQDRQDHLEKQVLQEVLVRLEHLVLLV